MTTTSTSDRTLQAASWPLCLALLLAAGGMTARAGELPQKPPTPLNHPAALGPGAASQPDSVRSGNWQAREGMYFQRNWGVEIMGLRRVASGYMLRLNFRVIDPAKAKPLFDKTTRPYVIDTASGAHLAVPAMENIGELRQTGTPVAGRNYFMVFGNPGRLVQPGAQVSIVLGNLRVDGFSVD